MNEGRRPNTPRADPTEDWPGFLYGRTLLRAWWTLAIVGTVALLLVTTGWDRLLPGAGTALTLGLRWVVGLAYAGLAGLTWSLPLPGLDSGWKLAAIVVAVLFLARAALATYAALN